VAADRHLEVDVVERVDGVWLRLKGELDLETLAVLREAFDEAEAASGSGEQVVIDAADLTWVGVSGVNALVDHAARVRHRGLALRLVHPTSSLRSLLRLLELERPLGLVC
jgi:anti-anti-sigma factor